MTDNEIQELVGLIIYGLGPEVKMSRHEWDILEAKLFRVVRKWDRDRSA